jgi:hypothetical protein
MRFTRLLALLCFAAPAPADEPKAEVKVKNPELRDELLKRA